MQYNQEYENEVREWAESQNNEFMQPSVAYFDSTEWCDAIEGDRRNPENHGWYVRLSAPGYLDCTDWEGPFDSEFEAMAELYDMFAL